MHSLLAWLLKFEPELFVRGSIELQWSWTAYASSAVLIAALVAFGLGYAGLDAAPRPFDRWLLWALRSALLALLLLVLLDPRLVVETEQPVRGHIAVLLDDSLSMRIADQDGAPRARFVERVFAPGTGALASELERRFDTRFVRFSDTSSGLAPGQRPGFSGARSDPAGALARLTAGPDASSLAAAVLVTDTAGEDPRALDDALRSLQAAGVRVHVIGVGAEQFDVDLQVDRVGVPRAALRGDTVDAYVALTHRGLGGRRVTLVVEDESRVVAEVPVALRADIAQLTTRVPVALVEPGARRLTFRVAAQPGELLIENNAVQRAVDVRDAPVRVLHIEGEPRFEVKFLRRAVASDELIELVSLVRTAENKYYRLGVEDPSELADGLPASEEALFRYDAIVLGSVDDALLDAQRQLLLREFVSRRGGGLVLLGGRRAFAEGGFSRSTLAAVSPVVLSPAANAFRAEVAVRRTEQGRIDPLLRVASEDRLDATWTRLPALTVVNPIRRAKPGATVLLEAEDGVGEPLIVLAWQRYGRGTVTAFAVRDSWRWQMHATIPLDDQSHERLWRNLLRHSARSAGGRLRMRIAPAEAALGEPIEVETEALDSQYRPLVDAELSLRVTTPSGAVEESQLEPALENPALYRARVLARESGRYEFRVRLSGPNGDLSEAQGAAEVSGSGSEYHSAELDATRLERIANATGGAFLRAADAERLLDRIDDVSSTRIEQRRLPLRDMPLLLVALLALACIEWGWRRRCALA